MKLRLVLIAIALAAPAALAGCFGKEDPIGSASCEGAACVTPPTGTVGPDGKTYPAPTARKTLSTTVTSSAEWVKPDTAVTLEAKSPSGASGAVTYSWGYVPRKAATTAPALDTKNINGGKTGALTFANEGTYLMHCHPHPFMKLTVNVAKSAATKGTAHVAILDGEKSSEFRFAPDEITVQPGTKITFWNNGTLMHTATQEGFEPPMKPIGSGQKVTFTPKETGDFNVVVVVKDAATGVGKATARVLVDASKPDESVTVPSMAGEFPIAFPAELAPLNEQVAPSQSHNFAAEYAIVNLTGTITASGQPAADMTITLADEAGTAIATVAATDGGFTAANLLPGKYTVTVTAGPGAEQSYAIDITYVQLLVPPAEAPASGEGHGDHAGH